MHMVDITLQLGGAVVFLSSWNRTRFFRKAGLYGITLYPCKVNIPISDDGELASGLYFATTETDRNLAKAGKVMFKDSLGVLSGKPASLTQLAANVRALS